MRRWAGVHKLAAAAAFLGVSLWVLKGGVSGSDIGATTIRVANSAVQLTTTRASSKYCTEADGGLVSLAANTPCVDANGVNVEGQSTNLVLQSQALGTTPWVAIGTGPPAAPTVTNNTADVTAPDGTSTATKAVFPATTASNQYTMIHQQVALSPGQKYTFSAWVRGTGPSTFYIDIDDAAGNPAAYTACPVTTSWSRCTVALTPVAGTNAAENIGSDTRTTYANEPNMAAQTVYLWGVQLEQQSFATSYIPTTTTTATRQADNIKTASAIAVGPNGFCASADVVPVSVAPQNNPWYWLQGYVGSGDRLDFYVQQSGALMCEYVNGGGPHQVSTPTGLVTSGTKSHLRCSFDGTNITACVGSNCTTGAAGFSSTISSAYTFGFGFDQTGSQYVQFGSTSNLAVSPQPAGCQ